MAIGHVRSTDIHEQETVERMIPDDKVKKMENERVTTVSLLLDRVYSYQVRVNRLVSEQADESIR